MQRNYYSNRFLDEDFEEAVRSKEKKVQEKYNDKELKDLHFYDAIKVNRALASVRTHNKYYIGIYRKCKRLMLSYLDRCIIEDLSALSYKKVLEFKVAHIDEAASYLSHLGFRMSDYWIFTSVACLIIDIILIVIGIAKYYYYIPIIFIVVTYAQLKGLYRAKKAGKLLR